MAIKRPHPILQCGRYRPTGANGSWPSPCANVSVMGIRGEEDTIRTFKLLLLDNFYSRAHKAGNPGILPSSAGQRIEAIMPLCTKQIVKMKSYAVPCWARRKSVRRTASPGVFCIPVAVRPPKACFGRKRDFTVQFQVRRAGWLTRQTIFWTAGRIPALQCFEVYEATWGQVQINLLRLIPNAANKIWRTIGVRSSLLPLKRLWEMIFELGPSLKEVQLKTKKLSLPWSGKRKCLFLAGIFRRLMRWAMFTSSVYL